MLRIRGYDISDIYDQIRHYFEVSEDVSEVLGSNHGQTLETIGASVQLNNPWNNVLISEARKFNVCYASAELLWYLSGSNSVNMIASYAPSYHKFAEQNGSVFGAYGPRLNLPNLIRALERDVNTRRAVNGLWMPQDLEQQDRLDVPCTTSLQVLIRNQHLNFVTTMRSNDVHLGFPNDVYCFTTLQILLSQWLGVFVGSYHHLVGSLHLYLKNKDVFFQRVTPGSNGMNAKEYCDFTSALEEMGQEPEFYDHPRGEDLVKVVTDQIAEAIGTERAIRHTMGMTINLLRSPCEGVRNPTLRKLVFLAGLHFVSKQYWDFTQLSSIPWLTRDELLSLKILKGDV